MEHLRDTLGRHGTPTWQRVVKVLAWSICATRWVHPGRPYSEKDPYRASSASTYSASSSPSSPEVSSPPVGCQPWRT